MSDAQKCHCLVGFSGLLTGFTYKRSQVRVLLSPPQANKIEPDFVCFFFCRFCFAVVLVIQIWHGKLHVMRSDKFAEFYVFNVILPEMVYTILVSIFLYYLILKVNQWLEKENRRSADRFVG